MPRVSAFHYSNYDRLPKGPIDCSSRPDFPSRCSHVRNRVQTEIPFLNPVSYCRPWLFSLYVLLHCRSSIVPAQGSSYSEVPVISPQGNGKQLQGKPYTNSEKPVSGHGLSFSKRNIRLKIIERPSKCSLLAGNQGFFQAQRVDIEAVDVLLHHACGAELRRRAFDGFLHHLNEFVRNLVV